MVSKQKLEEWVDLFLSHIEEITPEVHVQEEEGYKFKAVDTFQQNFNIDAPDLAVMLERSIVWNNLVAGSWYFPLKMLVIFAKEYEDETRQALKDLFDEQQPVAQRIDNAAHIFDTLMAARNKKLHENSHSFIGIRFLSLLLSYRFPNTYNALKPREWNVYCKYVDENFRIPNHTSAGKKYDIFEPYIEQLRLYIKDRQPIQELRKDLTRGLAFKDGEFRWMTQNVIYVTARVLADRKGAERPQQVSVSLSPSTAESATEAEPASLEFPLEEYLENFIVRNWDQINFGEPLRLYVDDEGTPAQQYPTSEGYIDILAKDTEDNFVVIELKKGRSNQQVVGQILGYVGWVKNNLAEPGQKVRGIIVASDGNQPLHDAVSMVRDFISVKYYRVKFSFEDPKTK